MLRTLYGDHDRFKQTYFADVPGCYFAGDGARRDEDGYIWVMGRIDDVINVAGHRLSTMEVESALVAHPKVAEAAVVGFPHEIKGEGICCFVSLKDGEGNDDLKKELIQHVRHTIGAWPHRIRFVSPRLYQKPAVGKSCGAVARCRRWSRIHVGYVDTGRPECDGKTACG